MISLKGFSSFKGFVVQWEVQAASPNEYKKPEQEAIPLPGFLPF